MCNQLIQLCREIDTSEWGEEDGGRDGGGREGGSGGGREGVGEGGGREGGGREGGSGGGREGGELVYSFKLEIIGKRGDGGKKR